MDLIAHNDGPELRGNERQLLLLAVGLRGRGRDLLVSCRAGAPLATGLSAAGVATTPVRPRGALALASGWRFRGLIRARRPAAVLLTSWKRLAAGAAAARSGGVGLVVARLGIVRRMPAHGLGAMRLRRALERVDALVVNSDAVRSAWLESAPWFPAERVRLIRNAVEVRSDAARGDPATASLRRELGLPDRATVVLTVAGLERRKGIDVLVRALSHLPATAHAVIAGEGRERRQLADLASSLGLERRVHWLGARSDVPALLAAADAFALPSRRDSIPNALLEAMAAGVPVVTTSGNGAEEGVGAREGRPAAGWVVPQDDPRALAGAIEEAVRTGSTRIREARWRAERWFGVDRMVDEFEGLLFGRRAD